MNPTLSAALQIGLVFPVVALALCALVEMAYQHWHGGARDD